MTHPILDLLERVGFRAGRYHAPTITRVGYVMYEYPLSADSKHLFIAMDDNCWALVARAYIVNGEPVSEHDTVERVFSGEMDEPELTKLVEGTEVEALLRVYKLGLLQQNIAS